MRIIIDYESSWRNSFLDGNNNEPLPKNGRKFIGSMKKLENEDNFICREVTLDTVMGVLNRLIGDQRKLYQSRQDENYYFKNMERLVEFKDKPSVVNREMTYIRNISGSTDQNAFSGLIKTDDPMLSSDFSAEFWGVLRLTLDEVCEFILNEQFIVDEEVSLDPIDIVEQAEFLDKKVKALENDGKVRTVIDLLNVKFSELITEKQPSPFVEKNQKVKPIRLYSAAMYIQLERLNEKYDMTKARTKSGKVAGFSKRGFNGRRDFMKNFVTGGEKKIWGNPYIHEAFVKGEGKNQHLMTKASGKLEIKINVDKDQGKELIQLIENAGVSSFHLGKKGLAYVSKMRA